MTKLESFMDIIEGLISETREIVQQDNIKLEADTVLNLLTRMPDMLLIVSQEGYRSGFEQGKDAGNATKH